MNLDSANIVILLGIFLPVVIFAQPQLSSSIGLLELSGEQCPGTLTLTCDARNLETIDTINWFVGSERFFLFDANSDSTPFTGTTTRPDILNATVQLTSVTISGNQSSFINFTLSASVSNFVSLQGQNISCGNLGPQGRSSSFRIREFTLINESTLFPYQDPGEIEVIRILPSNEEMLRIKWIISDSQCEGIVYNFRVFLRYSTISDNRTVSCSTTCEVFFPLSSAVYQYVVDVWTINSRGELVRKLSTINSTDEITFNHPSYSIEHTTCEATFMCISAVDGECVFEIIRNDATEHRQRGAVNSSVTFSNLMPNALYFYHINFTSLQPIQIIENNNFTTNEDVGSGVTALVGVGVVVFVLGLTEHLVAVFVCVYKTRQGVEVCWKRLIIISIFMATVMYLTIVIVWIVALVPYTQVSCGTLRSTDIAIHIVALVLSVMITLTSTTVILAVVLVVCPSKKCNPDEEVEYELEKGICSKTHTRPYKEEKKKPIEGSTRIDDKTTFETKVVNGHQVKDKKASASKSLVVTGDQGKDKKASASKAEVIPGDKVKEKDKKASASKAEVIPGDQGKDKKVSASKAEVIPGDQGKDKKASASKAEVIPGDKVKEKDKKASASKVEVIPGDKVKEKDKKASASKAEVIPGDQGKDKKASASKAEVIPGDKVKEKDKKASASKAEVIPGDQGKDKKASASKAEVIPGDTVKEKYKKASASKAEVVPGDQGKDKKASASKSQVVPGDQGKEDQKED